MAHACFVDRLAGAVKRLRSPVVVGLDPRKELLPAGLLPTSWGDEVDAIAQAYRSFCYGIIDAVCDLVPAVKPQSAFFEQLGPTGLRAMRQVIQYAQGQGLQVILDVKRSDIGSTAVAYADGYLGRESVWKADAITINPYLGDDSLEPFTRLAAEREAGVFVLVKTSNPGGGVLQDLVADEQPVYAHVAALVENASLGKLGVSGYGPVGAVVGATYPSQLEQLRASMPHCWFLVPGFGAQGGTAADVAAAFDEKGLGGIVNSSRGIIFAHAREEYREKFGDAQWQRAVEEATRAMIEELRTETSAGRL